MTDYYCVKCGTELTEVEEKQTGDASVIVTEQSFDIVLECRICKYQIGIDSSGDWKE